MNNTRKLFNYFFAIAVSNFVFAVLEGPFVDALLCIMDVALIKMSMIRKI